MIEASLKIKRTSQATRSGAYGKTADGIYQYVYDELVRLWRDGAGVFLDTVAENIHSLTGMTHGSLMGLAAKVGHRMKMPRILAPWGLTGYTDMNKNYHPNLIRSFWRGVRLGNSAYTFTTGLRKRPILNFKWHITVYQHWLHEDLGNYAHSIGYESLQLGLQAMMNFIDIELPNYISSRKIKDLIMSGMQIQRMIPGVK